MREAVTIAAAAELEQVEPTIDETLARLQDRLNALPPAEIVAVIKGVAQALAPASKSAAAVVTALADGQGFAPDERAGAVVEVLTRSFQQRRALLADALPTSQVAALLGTSRQTPHDRVESGSLLAVMDRGALRFPPWQFDPDGEDGVVAGLPAVVRALDVAPLAKISWLTRANPMLDGATPLARLKSGHSEEVLSLAHGVGAS